MAQKYFTQDGNPILVDAANKDGAGNNIVSQYSTKAELQTEINERKAAIDEIKGSGGLLSQYRKAADQDVIDTGIATTAATNLATHTDNTTVHLTATERAQWNAGYTHSQVAPGLTTIHHDVVSTKMADEQTAVTGIDSTNLAAKYDFAGNSITATYATKTECNAKYTKPEAGIGTTDLSSGVNASLTKADNAEPAIADLATIRSGAAAGATAVQPAAISDMATKTWVEGQGYLTQHQDISGKVDKEIVSTDGKALIFNESDGGGAKFEHVSGINSFVGVNNGGEDLGGLAAQIYAVDATPSGHNLGAKLDVTAYGMYYTTGAASGARPETRDVTENEIATKKDLPDLSAYSTTTAMNTAITSAVSAEASARDTAISIAKSETQSWVEGKGYLTEHQDISGKVDTTIQTAAGKALVANESDGGCIKFEGSTNWSAVSANDGGSGIGAQAYNWKVNGSTLQEGSVIDVTQDKVYYYNGAYTSAANRDIAGNEIARIKNIPTLDTLVTTQDLVASVAVGAIPQGTTISAGTSLSSLLKKIFEGTSTLNKFYYGTLKNLPTSDADIKAASTMTAVEMTEMVRADLQLGGYVVQLTPNVDYIVFAIDKADAFRLQTLIVGEDFDEGDIATLADTATLRVYCLGDSDKQPMKVGDGTTQETYKFICGTN